MTTGQKVNIENVKWEKSYAESQMTKSQFQTVKMRKGQNWLKLNVERQKLKKPNVKGQNYRKSKKQKVKKTKTEKTGGQRWKVKIAYIFSMHLLLPATANIW